MFLFTYTGFFLTVACLVFATYILYKKQNDILAWYFTVHLYAVALWVGSNAFADLAKSPLTNIFWAGFAFIGVSFFVSFYLCFVYVFVYKRKPPLWVRCVYFAPTVVFSLGAFSRFSIVDTLFPPGMPSSIVPGVFYKFHLVFFIVSLVYSSAVLIRFLWTEADRRERMQAVFMMLGFLILFAATVFFGIVLPVYFQEYRFFNVGPQFSLLLIVFSSYAILRHRLFDIELLIKKGAVFTVLFAVVVFLFNAVVSLLTNFVPGTISTVVAALIITAVFIPLKNMLERSTDRIFFRRRRSFTDAIDLLNMALVHAQEIDELVSKMVGVLREVMKSDKMALILVNEKGALEPYRKKMLGLSSVKLVKDSAIIEYLYYRLTHGLGALDVLEKEDLQYRIAYEPVEDEQKTRLIGVVKEMDDAGYKVVVPFISNGKILGLLFLGGKLSGDRYMDIDFRVLQALAHEGSVSLENAFNAERAVRLNELKTEFVRVISHQLRTPLTAAKWTVELLLSKNNPDELEEALADVQVNLMKINDGVNSMVTVMAIAQDQLGFEKSRASIPPLVSDVVKELRSLAVKKKVRVTISAKPKHIVASVDAEKIKKILTVLISNAVVYSPANGKVEVALAQDAHGLTLVVQDEGLGVPKKNRNEIFEKFFRGTEAKKLSPDGLGVNLYIAREFASMHGGKLWVEDRADGRSGAKFVLFLPKA